MSYFINIGVLQNYINKHVHQTGHLFSFSEAVGRAHSDGLTLEERPSDSDISYDFIDTNALSETISNSYIDVTSLIISPDTYSSFVDADYLPFQQSDVFPFFFFSNLKTALRTSELFEMVYVLRGNAIYFSPEGETLLPEGSFVIVPPHTSHDFRTTEENNLIGIYIKKDAFDSTLFRLLRSDNILSRFFYNHIYHSYNKPLVLSSFPSDYIRLTLQRLFTENLSSKPVSLELSMLYVEILLSEFIKNYSFQADMDATTNSAAINIPDVLNYIRTHYKTLSLLDLATYFNYSPDYVSRKLKEYTHLSFHRIVENYKMTDASDLLLNTSLSVTSIGQQVGYKSTDHFSRCFKRHFGQSPSEFRASLSNTIHI